VTARVVLERAGLPGGPLTRLDGGDVSDVARLDAHPWVVKTRRAAPDGLFESEARGLERLAAAGCRVPEVRYVDREGLVLSWLAPRSPDAAAWRDLAGQLARLHTAPVSTYGSETPGFIGPLPWPAKTGDCSSVWVDGRIRPILSQCRLPTALRSRLEAVLGLTPPLEGPVLLHGDLWRGNAHFCVEGGALIDPSVWQGERAVDLAMMTLFGGFPPVFWEAYRAEAPIPADVWEALAYWRVYFVLVHVALFGSGYLGALDRELTSADRALRA
jgi:fructosamine-3-kinase